MTHFAIHTSDGAQFTDGPPDFGKNSTKFEGFQGKVKTFVFSEDGKRFAWIADGQVFVVEAPSWERIGSLKHPRAQEICFSPQGNYLAIWESYVKTTDQSQIQPNLSVYDVTGKKPLKSFFQQSQVNWQPQWTNDETVFARSVTNEVHFYKADDLQNIVEKKILQKVRSFSISPSTATHYVTFFVPSIKGAPAYVHLYRYPNFKEASNALANKSFFKVDTIDSFWNKQSTACLLLTAAEMDKSGTSYYGEHMLFYLNTRGDSTRVTFSKPGNIHSVSWCPNGQEFFAVYGTMPSKATLYNHKCEAIAEFGSGARNTVLVNPVGNIALVGGFGNIAARFETWDIAARKKIGETECPDSTSFSWSPCGQYMLTATCSPRLRVNNGYKMWHYTAVLLHESFVNELYAAQWIPDPEAAKPFTISTTPVTGIESSIVAASKQKYILPSQRGAKGPVGLTNTEKKFLSEVDDPTKNEAPAQLSKSALKNKKKREAAKKKREEEGEAEKGGNNWREAGPPETAAPVKSFAANIELTGDPEKDKKIKNLKKKLDAIAKLKGEQENGKTLEKNQLDKIATEEKLIKDLEELTL
ncbi:eukaryotic translation initiation factor 2A [Procambarus clarkii]|uniref:eukaryotic translation initiation factor 2A n=1 Tax=Procambarus clarkii TaxID=6728 RepID=UPI001E678B16|nr:eukaryotic translation initiation factor 2A-like [Procambarus clarkii]